MSSPLIPIGCFLLVAVGFVLLFQGSLGRDPGLGFSESQQLFDERYEGMRHDEEKHPRRLMAIGAGLIVLGIGLVVLWGAIWG